VQGCWPGLVHSPPMSTACTWWGHAPVRSPRVSPVSRLKRLQLMDPIPYLLQQSRDRPEIRSGLGGWCSPAQRSHTSGSQGDARSGESLAWRPRWPLWGRAAFPVPVDFVAHTEGRCRRSVGWVQQSQGGHRLRLSPGRRSRCNPGGALRALDRGGVSFPDHDHAGTGGPAPPEPGSLP